MILKFFLQFPDIKEKMLCRVSHSLHMKGRVIACILYTDFTFTMRNTELTMEVLLELAFN